MKQEPCKQRRYRQKRLALRVRLIKSLQPLHQSVNVEFLDLHIPKVFGHVLRIGHALQHVPGYLHRDARG